MVFAVVKLAVVKTDFSDYIGFPSQYHNTLKKDNVNIAAMQERQYCAEQSILETSACLEPASLTKIYPLTVRTFRTIHILGKIKIAVTPQLVNAPLPACVKFIPHYVKIGHSVQE